MLGARVSLVQQRGHVLGVPLLTQLLLLGRVWSFRPSSPLRLPHLKCLLLLLSYCCLVRSDEVQLYIRDLCIICRLWSSCLFSQSSLSLTNKCRVPSPKCSPVRRGAQLTARCLSISDLLPRSVGPASLPLAVDRRSWFLSSRR